MQRANHSDFVPCDCCDGQPQMQTLIDFCCKILDQFGGSTFQKGVILGSGYIVFGCSNFMDTAAVPNLTFVQLSVHGSKLTWMSNTVIAPQSLLMGLPAQGITLRVNKALPLGMHRYTVCEQDNSFIQFK